MSQSTALGLMSIPKQHLDDKAYNVGNFFDYGNDYNRALVEQEYIEDNHHANPNMVGHSLPVLNNYGSFQGPDVYVRPSIFQ